MKLHESTGKKMIKVKNGEKVPHIEITEVVLGHWNIVSNDYQHKFCMHLFLINHLVFC